MLHSPESLQLLIDRIRDAAAQRTPLQIRGGGSKDFHGSLQPAALLDTRSLTGVIDYAPSELVVTVAAGTPLQELEALLAAQGQCLPFEPPHFGWSGGAATVGGMVASGLAGPARASAGSVRDYVLGLKLVNGKGELLTFGGQVMKNVAGYDVSRLMAGAMGTLGLITEVSLKVLPLAPAEATLAFPADQATALEQLHRWGGQPLPLNASRWVSGASPGRAGRDMLFVRLRGALAAVETACQRMLAERAGERLDTVPARLDWVRCRDQQLPFFTGGAASGEVLWRLSVAQTAPVLDLPWPQWIEWHGGLRWLWAPLQAGPTLQAAAKAASGNATVFYATGTDALGAKGRSSEPTPAHKAMLLRLKAAFDPAGILNPGRLYPDF